MSGPPPFKHRPLDLDPDKLCIRLLKLLPAESDGTIRCHIDDNISLSARETRSYIAISYEWGQATDTHHPIYVNDCSLMIRQNLFDFMSDFISAWPDAEDKALWIDALCIDQSNVRERNHQVSQMKQIYQAASCVVAWLGPAADDSDFLFSLIKNVELIPPTRDLEYIVDEIDEHYTWATKPSGGIRWWNKLDANEVERVRFLNAMQKLAHRSYWSRTWVIQEMILPSRLLFKCGSKTISWPKLYWTNAVPDRAEGHFTDNAYYPDGSVIPEDSVVMMALEARFRYLESPQRSLGSLSSVLRNFRTTQSAEARDKVYALLAVADGDGDFEIDYEAQTATVFYQLIRLIQSWNPERSSPSWGRKFHPEGKKSRVLGSELPSVLSALGLTLSDVIQTLLSSVTLRLGHIERLSWDSEGSGSGPLSGTSHNGLENPAPHIDVARDMEIQVTVSSAFLQGTKHHKMLMKHHWEGILALARRKRVKLCECDLCNISWRRQPLVLKASSTHLRRFNENIFVRTDTGCMFFYACSNFHACADEPLLWAYSATGILLKQRPTTVIPIEEWDFNDLASADFEDTYLLLYHDQTMAPREAPDRHVNVSWSLPQLANLAAHQSPGRICVDATGGRKCVLGPCSTDLSSLLDVPCTFRLLPERYNRPLKLAIARLPPVNVFPGIESPSEDPQSTRENNSVTCFLGGPPKLTDLSQVVDVMKMAQELKAKDWQSSNPCILDNNCIYTLSPNQHWDTGDSEIGPSPREVHWSDAYRSKSSNGRRDYQLL